MPSATMIELAVLAGLSLCWLAFHGQVTKQPGGDVYHVAAEKQDRRRARFYFMSVWVGIVAAFFSARTLEALGTSPFDSAVERSAVLGSLRAVELWGLLVIGAVWSRVGYRVCRTNSDGQSLQPREATMQERKP